VLQVHRSLPGVPPAQFVCDDPIKDAKASALLIPRPAGLHTGGAALLSRHLHSLRLSDLRMPAGTVMCQLARQALGLSPVHFPFSCASTLALLAPLHSAPAPVPPPPPCRAYPRPP